MPDERADNQTEESRIAGDATPLCVKCLAPVDSRDYYCRACGEATGLYTPYVPFVNIPFNYSIYVEMWRRVWRRGGASFLTKIGYLLLTGYMAGIVFLGLPWAIRNRLRRC